MKKIFQTTTGFIKSLLVMTKMDTLRPPLRPESWSRALPSPRSVEDLVVSTSNQNVFVSWDRHPMFWWTSLKPPTSQIWQISLGAGAIRILSKLWFPKSHDSIFSSKKYVCYIVCIYIYVFPNIFSLIFFLEYIYGLVWKFNPPIPMDSHHFPSAESLSADLDHIHGRRYPANKHFGVSGSIKIYIYYYAYTPMTLFVPKKWFWILIIIVHDYLGKWSYFTKLNCWAIKGDDFPY